ncbi:MAG: SpoIID/LytB domain-containing protein [Lachnospiraceae bacterium]|nr:SpoIID/LytB domain-containing protein [Lachnospiraceae bacterium]
MKDLIKWLACFCLILIAAWIAARTSERLLEWDEEGVSQQQIMLKNGDLVDVETFVLYLAAAQVPVEYGPETLKCQAVIARTFLLREMDADWEFRAEKLGADYWDERIMQKNWGLDYTKNREKFEMAVKETAGKTLQFEGDYIAPVFHRMSAGSTRTAGEEFPYLIARKSTADLLAEEGWQVYTKSLKELATSLTNAGFSLKPGEFWTKVQIVARDAAGYVEQVQVGEVLISGEQIAELWSLPSPCFRWEEAAGAVRIFCRGQGHGYGLSQNDAHAQEASGSTYEELLQYFYPGTTVS